MRDDASDVDAEAQFFRIVRSGGNLKLYTSNSFCSAVSGTYRLKLVACDGNYKRGWIPINVDVMVVGGEDCESDDGGMNGMNGENGENRENGENGENGPNGENGENGSKTARMATPSTMAINGGNGGFNDGFKSDGNDGNNANNNRRDSRNTESGPNERPEFSSILITRSFPENSLCRGWNIGAPVTGDG